jgi:predicted transcriptional regulator
MFPKCVIDATVSWTATELRVYPALLDACAGWDGKVTGRELATRLELNTRQVNRAVQSLLNRGHVERVGSARSPGGCGYRFEGLDWDPQEAPSMEPQSTEQGAAAWNPTVPSLGTPEYQAEPSTPYTHSRTLDPPSKPPSQPAKRKPQTRVRRIEGWDGLEKALERVQHLASRHLERV